MIWLLFIVYAHLSSRKLSRQLKGFALRQLQWAPLLCRLTNSLHDESTDLIHELKCWASIAGRTAQLRRRV